MTTFVEKKRGAKPLHRLLIEKNEQGFTLMEVVITVAVVLILSIGGFMSYQGFQSKARDAAVESAAEQVYTGAAAERMNKPNTDLDAVAASYNATADGITASIAEGANDICVSAEMDGYPEHAAQRGDCDGVNIGGDNTGGDNNGDDQNAGGDQNSGDDENTGGDNAGDENAGDNTGDNNAGGDNNAEDEDERGIPEDGGGYAQGQIVIEMKQLTLARPGDGITIVIDAAASDFINNVSFEDTVSSVELVSMGSLYVMVQMFRL